MSFGKALESLEAKLGARLALASTEKELGRAVAELEQTIGISLEGGSRKDGGKP
jgi:hypothetical protein